MYSSYNAARKKRKRGEFKGKLEEQINQSLLDQGLEISYEKERFDYYLKRFYTPDFLVKGNAFDFWIEVKGYWPSSKRTQFLAVLRNHPTLDIFVALQSPHQRISKQSRTTYCQWCEKYGVAWCPTPIPEDFLNQWVTGRKVSFRAPEATSKAKVKSKAADPATQPECQLTMDQFIASAAGGIS